MKKRKKGLIIGILSFAIIALIIAIGGKLYMGNKENENLENQKSAALELRKKEPLVTKVKFTTEGYRPGFGSWGVEADVTMDGEVFKTIIHENGSMMVYFDGDETQSKKYDEIMNRNSSQKHPLLVIYSNGREEVIQ